MHSLALSRLTFRAAVLVTPDLTGGHVGGMTLGPVARRAMQTPGVRHLLQAGINELSAALFALGVLLAMHRREPGDPSAISILRARNRFAHLLSNYLPWDHR